MINYLAVIVVTLLNYLILGMWYSSILFGNLWMRLTKIKEGKMTPQIIIFGLIGSLITTLALAFLIDFFSLFGFLNGAVLGAIIWIGFTVPFLLNEVLYEKRNAFLYILNITGYLLILAVSGGILAVWH